MMGVKNMVKGRFESIPCVFSVIQALFFDIGTNDKKFTYKISDGPPKFKICHIFRLKIIPKKLLEYLKLTLIDI